MIFKSLFGKRTEKLDRRFFATIYVTCLTLLIFTSIATYLEMKQPAALYCGALAMVLTILAKMLTVRKGNFEAGYLAICLIIGCILVPMEFILCGGSRSCMPAFFVLVFITGILCPNRKYRFIAMTLVFLVVCVLFFIESHFPEKIHYMEERAGRFDLIHGTLVVLLGSGYFFSRLMNDYTSLVDTQIHMLEEKNRMYIGMLGRETERTNALREFRHDVHHYNNTLLELLQAGHTEKAISLLKAFDSADHRGGSRLYCVNLALNSVLNYMERLCVQKGISFSAEADVAENISVSSDDLTVAAANLLENAVNGADASGCGKKNVVFRAVTNEGRLLLSFENTCRDDIRIRDGMIADRSIGIRSVCTVMDRYEGTIEYRKTDEHTIQCVLLLNLED